MGFSSVLVDKVIEENGPSDVNLLLEALINSSKSSPEESDSWEDFEKEEVKSPAEFTSDCKQEIEDQSGPSSAELDKKSYLLMMDFSEEQIGLAISRLGVNATLPELVDFIVTVKTADFSREKKNDSVDCSSQEDEETTTATLFGTMDKTICLLRMGFTENEVSSAIYKYGPEVPINELANSILANRMAFNVDKEEDLWDDATDTTGQSQNGLRPLGHESDAWITKAPSSSDAWITKASSLNDAWITKQPSCSAPHFDDEDVKTAKKAKHMFMEENTSSCSNNMQQQRTSDWEADYEMKPSEYDESPAERGWVKEEVPFKRTPNLRSKFSGMLSKPPYFFYGNVVDVSQATWQKLSQFLYATEPEFANSQFFSALIRKEGYLHNLPTDRRFHIIPKPPMTIEDALPHTKKWWPSWDTRKQLSCISSEATGVVQLCERLGKMMMDSQGFLSKEQQTDIIHQCKRLNLIWVGRNKLRPMEPDQVETILGYPREHTEIWGLQPIDRLATLKYCFQTDTIGYHLSVLKNMFPHGLKVLSIFTGVGGAEIALHRLGIYLKCVVSVEASEINRRILKRWWQSTGQTGELRQIGGIEKLTMQLLKNCINQFDGFDIIIGSNPGEFNRVPKNDMDFNLFFEYVRVFQRVRSIMGRS
ncbi:probable inactive DNA (cytosine-5)-methyltransferase DRM3 isoform X1 [Asparagus officinalis]|nr:probable inactive DNA (cytosine-5)-methyltransferase DRM3 isoform X1 [Asparagus officinalis]